MTATHALISLEQRFADGKVYQLKIPEPDYVINVQVDALKNGVAVVTVNMDRKYTPVYKNAHVLLRPKTGLKDMFLELDPGTNYDANSNDDEFQSLAVIHVEGSS